MKLNDLNRLTRAELKRIERVNKFSFHSLMLASVFMIARAFSEINALVLLFAFGLVLLSQTFYANLKLIRNVQHNK